jgi:hypothetical protein
MTASAEALLLFVPVASDAAASSGARGLRQKAAIGAVESDGGNNASAIDNRTDAPDAARTLRPGCADDHGPFGVSRRIRRTRDRADQPGEHPPRTRPATRSLSRLKGDEAA